MSDTIHSRTMAPMVAVSSVPNAPTGNQPRTWTIQPPRKPPIIPTMRLMMRPEPLPLTIMLAIQPATRPMIRYQRIYIAQIYYFSACERKMCARCLQIHCRKGKIRAYIIYIVDETTFFLLFSKKKFHIAFFLRKE